MRTVIRAVAILLLSVACAARTIPRDSHGRIKRSHAARVEFMRQHPCPSSGLDHGRCPGWIVDHVKPLECGGPDTPENMQWQTVCDAHIKDRTERVCRL